MNRTTWMSCRDAITKTNGNKRKATGSANRTKGQRLACKSQSQDGLKPNLDLDGGLLFDIPPCVRKEVRLV